MKHALPQPPPQPPPRQPPRPQPQGRIPVPTGPLPPVTDLPTRRVELSDAALVSRSWAMAFATLVSRLTGFARIVLLAAILGAALSSAFSVANQLPNLVAALVLEATFTAIFVPVLARAEQSDPDGGAAFVRRLVTVTTTLLICATALSVVAAPLLVRLMLGRSPQVNDALTTAFAYLLLPQVLAYGLTSVFMAILNTRNVFGPTAWAPVVNNIVALATLAVYLAVPGELSVDPVQMGNTKLLVLGIGTTVGVYAQTAVLLIALKRERISLRPLWGIDDRLKRFGAMAAAMVLYVLISQLGLVVGNQIASTAAASGPAIYNYTWLVLMLPFGMIGVTVLTVVMPRLSRNAAASDTKAVLGDLSLATRLTLITLIPIVAFMTVGGPAIGSALFAYGHFGGVDAGYLGAAIALSAFTLLPYGLVLLQLRVFYAREQPWTPIVIILVITAVKIAGSVLAPHATSHPELVAGYLGLANGLGFLAGAVVGYYLLRRTLLQAGGHLVGVKEVRTVLVTLVASMLAGLVAHIADRLLGLNALTVRGGGAGSLLRLVVLAAIMLPITAAVMVRARVPEAQAALNAVRRRIGGRGSRQSVAVSPHKVTVPEASSGRGPVTYPEQRNSSPPGGNAVQEPIRRRPPERASNALPAKGPEVTDRPMESAPSAGSGSGSGAPPQRPIADDFQPDIPSGFAAGPSAHSRSDQYNGDLAAEHGRGPAPLDPPGERGPESSSSSDDVHLVPGARIAGGRYRLLVFHGGAPPLQFWQALDTALDRQVALTFVDPDGALPEDVLQEILSRTLRLSRIDKPGIARVLDVVHTGSGGLVVAEWIRGGSLQEVADTAPSSVGAVRAMQSLAAAADAAHRAGVALSIDHPSRVRVSIEGEVVLAYPATMPDANPEDDIRGIGASLYALLVNRWPLPESGVRSGFAPADRDASGLPVEPTVIDRDIPFQISAVAVRAIQEDGGIRSASTLLNLLQQATAVADRTEVLGPIDDSTAPPAPRPSGQEYSTLVRRRRGLLVGIGAAAVIIVVALLVLASIVSKIFGNVGGLNKDELGLNGPSSSNASSTANPSPAGATVKPTKASVYSPDGEPDNPGQAGQAIDGDPGTSWSTEIYTDAVPFPSFKQGEGLMLQLPSPTVVGQVNIDASSTGTKVEIRSASTPSPSKLEDTTLLAPAYPLKPGHNVIPVRAGSPTSNLLVWITTLGSSNGKSQASFSEITVQAAS